MKPIHYHRRVRAGTAPDRKGIEQEVWRCTACGVILEGPGRDVEAIRELGRTWTDQSGGG